MMLGTCEAELEEVSVHEREQQLIRRQRLKQVIFNLTRNFLGIPDDGVQVKTHHWLSKML